jgi:hypothetical protein
VAARVWQYPDMQNCAFDILDIPSDGDEATWYRGTEEAASCKEDSWLHAGGVTVHGRPPASAASLSCRWLSLL